MTDPHRLAALAQGMSDVTERIERARVASGRTDPIDLLVVTKTFPASDVRLLAGLGAGDVGENRDQEARGKRDACSDLPLRWHMIGQLQRNKANSVARWADVVESIDRAELAAALGRGALAAGRRVEVLIQVCLDPLVRVDRGGVSPAHAVDLAASVEQEPGLALRGVMGVAPFPGDPDEAFGRLQALSAQLRDRWPRADRISAGMSGDLEEAIRHGATQVRIGGAILGQRASVQ